MKWREVIKAVLYTLLSSRGQISFVELLLLFVSYALLVFVMLPVHEMAHAFAAYKLGDNTAYWNGRLRFNPLAHMDPIGTAMLVLFGIGYARPVPVNPRNFRNPRRDMALTALAGPVSNILMAALSIAIYRVLTFLPLSATISALVFFVFIQVLASVNIGLAVFNLLPIPPLDGSRILSLLLPDRYAYSLERYSAYIRMGLLLLVFSGALDVPLDYLRDGLMTLLLKLFGFY